MWHCLCHGENEGCMMEDDDLKEEIANMDESDSKKLLKAAYKTSLKKSKEEGSKQSTKVKQKNAKMRKMFRSFSKSNKGV